MQSQSVLRTPQYKDATLVVQRNSIQLENTWNFIRNSQNLHRRPVDRLLEEVTFKLIYRFAYDSTYDISDSRREHFTKGQRSQLKFENWVREAYVDLGPPAHHPAYRSPAGHLGRDRHLPGAGCHQPPGHLLALGSRTLGGYPLPAVMTRAIYDIGKFGPFEESFIEGIWIPRRFQTQPGLRQPASAVVLLWAHGVAGRSIRPLWATR